MTFNSIISSHLIFNICYIIAVNNTIQLLQQFNNNNNNNIVNSVGLSHLKKKNVYTYLVFFSWVWNLVRVMFVTVYIHSFRDS